MNYKLSISGFSKDFESASTGSEIIKNLLGAGVYCFQTGYIKRLKGVVLNVSVKSQEMQFKTLAELNYSMKLLEAASRNTGNISITVKTES